MQTWEQAVTKRATILNASGSLSNVNKAILLNNQNYSYFMHRAEIYFHLAESLITETFGENIISLDETDKDTGSHPAPRKTSKGKYRGIQAYTHDLINTNFDSSLQNLEHVLNKICCDLKNYGMDLAVQNAQASARVDAGLGSV